MGERRERKMRERGRERGVIEGEIDREEKEWNRERGKSE